MKRSSDVSRCTQTRFPIDSQWPVNDVRYTYASRTHTQLGRYSRVRDAYERGPQGRVMCTANCITCTHIVRIAYRSLAFSLSTFHSILFICLCLSHSFSRCILSFSLLSLGRETPSAPRFDFLHLLTSHSISGAIPSLCGFLFYLTNY